MKDEKEINEAAERAADLRYAASDSGSKYPSMTYEDGLRDALDWVCGNQDDDPTL
jgi:hypothetical protein